MSSTESQELLLAIDNIIVKHLSAFEKKVNIRLDKIEEQIKVIPQMQEDIRIIQEKIKVIPQMQEDIRVIQEKIKVIPGMQSNIESIQYIIGQMQNDIKELQNNYKELYKETRNISRTVAKIEVEHGEKLAILFDVLTGNTEKQEILEKRLDKCEKRIDINKDQIYFLNSKIQNL